MDPLRHALAACGVVLLLSGCAAFRSYDAELYPALEQASSGNVDGAIRLLESNNRLPDKDLLYFMELGMLQRLGNRYDESQKAWMAAEARIEASRDDSFAEVREPGEQRLELRAQRQDARLPRATTTRG